MKQYKVHGEIVRLDTQGRIAAIRHQKIQGWMDAMTMEFPVKTAPDFAALKVGDCIDATVFVQGMDYWIGEIQHPNIAAGSCLNQDSKAP